MVESRQLPINNLKIASHEPTPCPAHTATVKGLLNFIQEIISLVMQRMLYFPLLQLLLPAMSADESRLLYFLVELEEPSDVVSDVFPRNLAKGHLHITVLRGK